MRRPCWYLIQEEGSIPFSEPKIMVLWKPNIRSRLMFFFVPSQAMSIKPVRRIAGNYSSRSSKIVLPRRCPLRFPRRGNAAGGLAVVDGNADAQNTLQLSAGQYTLTDEIAGNLVIENTNPSVSAKTLNIVGAGPGATVVEPDRRAGMTAFFQLLAAIRRSRCKASKFLEGWLRTAASLERVRHWEAAC